MAQTVSLLFSAQHSANLQGVIEDRGRPVKHVHRAQIVLLSAERLPVLEIVKRVGISRPMVWRWQQRFAEEGLLRACCATRPVRPASRQCRRPRCVPWSSAPCANRPAPLPIGPAAPWPRQWVFRCERSSASGPPIKLQPHRIRTFKRSNDPDFAKLDDVVGLYMNPPRHAVGVSIDEKSQIQALDRTQPGLPLKRGKCATLTHDYKRNGTTTLPRHLIGMLTQPRK
jgi:hypothetical protein